MRMRGRTFVRRHDVYHLATRSQESIRRFSKEIGFANAGKASRLSDFVALLGLSPEERYRWFMASYVKLGRKWTRIGKWSRKSVPRVGRFALRGAFEPTTLRLLSPE